MSSASESSTSPSPVGLNAPKFGSPVPNRIFVGGISLNTTKAELQALFSKYGCVTETKIISDRAGVSKGYGFVTFETEEEAERIQQEAENIVLHERKLNIAPAIRKQPFSRVCSSPQVIPNGTIMYHNNVPYTYQNGMAFFPTPESLGYVYPQTQMTMPTSYPVLYSQAVLLPPPHYQHHTAAPTVPAPYAYATLPPASTSTTSANATDMYQYTTATSGTLNMTGMQPVAYFASSALDYAEGSRAESTAPEGAKSAKKSGVNTCSNVYESPRKNFNALRGMRGNPAPSGGGGDASRTIKHIQSQQPHLVPKTVNGVTLMAYPTPIMVSAPSLTPQAKDHAGGDHETIGTEMGILHPLTPPHTPNTSEACEVMRKLQGLAV